MTSEFGLYIMNSVTSVAPFDEDCSISPGHLVFGSLVFGIYVVSLFLFSYIFYGVFITLTAIENSTYSPIPLNDIDQASLLSGDAQNDPESEIVISNKPITASIFGTARHLRAIGGYLSLFRGFGVWMSLNLIGGLATAVLFALFRRFGNIIGLFLADIIANLIFARWLMAWTWIVISEPSPLNWWRRIPPKHTWSKVLPATLLFTVAEIITTSALFLFLLDLDIPSYVEEIQSNPNSKIASTVAMRGLVANLVFILMTVLVMIPAKAVLARVHSSMLPEETEAIVPFDRSYNGKVVPQVMGGNGCLGIIDAFRSFTIPSWIRIFKLYLKAFILECCLMVFFGFIYGVQLRVILKGAEHCLNQPSN